MAAARTRRPGYRRRRPIPAIIVLAILIVLSGFLWTRVFETSDDIEAATRCNQPASQPVADQASQNGGEPQSEQLPLGTMQPRTALDDTSPIPPQDVPVRVFNANGERMQAALVGQELGNLGFASGGEAGNDPIYTEYDLNCHGQIRYGGAGVSAARTLSLMVPCAQLVRDDREDATVDLALGTRFDDIRASSEAMQVLQELKNWVPQRDQQDGAQNEVSKPPIKTELLTDARDVHC